MLAQRHLYGLLSRETQLTHAVEGTRHVDMGALPGQVATLSALQKILVVLACVFAPMIAHTIKPSTTILNQVASLVTWGLFAAVFMGSLGRRTVSMGRAGVLISALALLLLGVLGSYSFAFLPLPMTLATTGGLLAAMLLVYVGIMARQAGYTTSLMGAVSLGWIVLGLLSFLVGCVQAFVPSLVGNEWIAATSFPGRAVGNLRQPNQLATILLWASVGLVWMNEMGRLRRVSLGVLLAAFTFGVVLSGSRTGQFGVLVLAVWAVLDRRLAPTSRSALMWNPAVMAVAWVGLSVWARFSEQILGATARVGEGLGSSRFGVWVSAWEMIRQYPLTGVGWGSFNLAWTFTPNANRLVEVFDHAHSLPLQLMAELGLPLGLLIVLLLCLALKRAFSESGKVAGQEGTALRCSFMMVLLVGIHSLMEYPLWFIYFLLPTALLWGLCLGRRRGAEVSTTRPEPVNAGVLKLSGVLLAVIGIATFADFMRVAWIYAPKVVDLPLIERIERAQGSWLFAPQADFAFATNYPPGEATLAASKRAAPRLADLVLLRAWAMSLYVTGDVERARYVAERLREFQHEDFFPWFAECDAVPALGQPKPFQCTPPTKVFTYRDML